MKSTQRAYEARSTLFSLHVHSRREKALIVLNVSRFSLNALTFLVALQRQIILLNVWLNFTPPLAARARRYHEAFDLRPENNVADPAI